MSTTFSRGDITVDRIVELEVPFADALSFLPGLQPDILEEHRSWLVPGALTPQGQLIFCFQSYIVRTPHHTILIDSCVGNHKNRNAFPAMHMKSDETYMRALASAGLTVDDIDFVLCTHLHFDHVGWNTRLEDGRWVPTFPNARYLFAQREYAHWIEQHAKAPVACIADSVLPIIEAKQAELVRSDHALDDHVQLLPTPGHTPDHFSVCLGRGMSFTLRCRPAIRNCRCVPISTPSRPPLRGAGCSNAVATRNLVLHCAFSHPIGRTHGLGTVASGANQYPSRSAARS